MIAALKGKQINDSADKTEQYPNGEEIHPEPIPLRPRSVVRTILIELLWRWQWIETEVFVAYKTLKE